MTEFAMCTRRILNRSNSLPVGLAFVLVVPACSPNPKLPNPNGLANDNAGFSVAIDGGRAISGVPKSDTIDSNGGKALIYAGSGSSWSLEATIVPSASNFNGQFGWSVDIAGDRAIVAAFQDASLGFVLGAAYIFERLDGLWTERAQVFGDTLHGAFSVAIDADRAVVGDPYPPPPTFAGPGIAFVYRRNPGNAGWVLEATLSASDAIDFIEFGADVDIEDDVIVVGAQKGVVNNMTIGGAAYVFRRQGSNWIEEQKLTALDPAYHDRFGAAVSISGDVIVIGAHEDDPAGDASGSAYVFRRDPGTGVWSQTQKLVPEDGDAGDNFGRAVAVDGPRLMIGAWLANGDTTTTGAAYFYRAGPDGWQFEDKRFRSNGHYGDGYGFSVDVSDDCAIVGAVNEHAGDVADIGAAYVYCNLPGALPPGWIDIDIICCVEIPDPIGPVIALTHLLNPGETTRLGRRWVEWQGEDGESIIITGAETVSIAPGETRDERHPVPANARRPGILLVHWQDEHGIRTDRTVLPASAFVGAQRN
jgi:hypothetical protein